MLKSLAAGHRACPRPLKCCSRRGRVNPEVSHSCKPSFMRGITTLLHCIDRHRLPLSALVRGWRGKPRIAGRLLTALRANFKPAL